MQRVFLITTGGTIEKEYSEQLGTVRNHAADPDPQGQRSVRGVGAKIGQYLKLLRLPGSEIEIIPMMNKDSLEMTAEDRAALVAELARLLPQGHPIVITHGTDTMVETGLSIERAFADLQAPIVLTGAMTPLGFEGSDGLQNLTESLLAARLLAPGVYVVMHGQVFPAAHVRKDRDLATFVPA